MIKSVIFAVLYIWISRENIFLSKIHSNFVN